MADWCASFRFVACWKVESSSFNDLELSYYKTGINIYQTIGNIWVSNEEFACFYFDANSQEAFINFIIIIVG